MSRAVRQTTPALLFPAISLLLLAYTDRFLTLAGPIRELHGRYQEACENTVLGQIVNLRTCVRLIRAMQALGVGSFGCVFCMFSLFFGLMLVAQGGAR